MKCLPILLLFYFGYAPALAAQTAPMKDTINELITRLFAATDAREWQSVERLFADSVVVDYSDLGGLDGKFSPPEITEAWSAVLPGFEATVHQPHNVAIWTAGNRATTTFDALAMHYLDPDDGSGDYWVVFAGYDAEFKRSGEEWKIDRLRLSLYDQAGNDGLGLLAARRVASGDAAGKLADTDRIADIIEDHFAALENSNLDAFVNGWAEGGIQIMDFSPDGFPNQLEGREAIREQYKTVVGYESQRYPHTVHATSNPKVALVKYTGEVQVNDSSRYDNSYVAVVEVNQSGKVERFVEDFNPRILLHGFPGLQPAHYSVHPVGAAPTTGVELREVSFDSKGDKLVGHLFLPPGFDASRQYPAAIVTGSWTSVKEQMPDEYASLLAQDGLVTLTFDFRGFGGSEGVPRQFEDYERKTEDIVAAMDYLSTHPNVERQSIAGVGVCASAGYMARAVGEDDRFSRLALIAPWLHDPAKTEELYGNRPGGKQGLLDRATAARRKLDRTGEVEYTLAASELDPLAAMYVPDGAFPYYLRPDLAAGQVYDNRFAVISWEPWLTFDGIGTGKSVSKPVFIVHSENGAVPEGTKRFYDQLGGKKDIVWLNDYSQQQLYHDPEAVGAAISRVSNYLRQ